MTYETKAELLSLSGQPQQSIRLYRDYIKPTIPSRKEEIARQLDELRIQYEVEKTQQENLQKTPVFTTSFYHHRSVTLLLSLYIIYANKLNAKNRLL